MYHHKTKRGGTHTHDKQPPICWFTSFGRDYSHSFEFPATFMMVGDLVWQCVFITHIHLGRQVGLNCSPSRLEKICIFPSHQKDASGSVVNLEGSGLEMVSVFHRGLQLIFYFYFYFLVFFFFMATLMAYGGSQSRVWIGAAAADHSHSNGGIQDTYAT